MKVRVRLFGHFADYWPDERELDVAEGAKVGDVAAQVAAGDERLAGVARICRAAVNEEYVHFSDQLKAGELVVFIPPMSGG